MSAAEPAKPPKQNPVASNISSFVHGIDALHASLPIQLAMTSAVFIVCHQNYSTFVDKYGEKDASTRTNRIGPEHFLEYNRLLSRLKKAHAATVILPQTFVLALVSQYDAFLGGLLRCLYRAKPELLKGSEKNLTYSQLCDFSDLEHAKADILEKEIETILRMSHSEQFDTMQTRFQLKLREKLPIWPVFIELTERRNLFAHCSGVVSAQYLTVCDRHKVDYGKKPDAGDTLDVTPAYFEKAHACIFEIGVKLAHVLWRKILPDEREEADGNLLMLGYDLLVAKYYDLAVTLGTFALEPVMKHSSDGIRRRMAINLAQAYKWGGKTDEAAKIIDAEDWSSCGPEFQIAVSVLKDDFEKAAGLMRVIASANLMNKTDYRDWPLFNEFRKSQVFVDAYQSIYGHQLVPIEPHLSDRFFGPLDSKMTTHAEIVESPVGKTTPEQIESDKHLQQP